MKPISSFFALRRRFNTGQERLGRGEADRALLPDHLLKVPERRHFSIRNFRQVDGIWAREVDGPDAATAIAGGYPRSAWTQDPDC